jgi:hypothetical protein
MVLHTCIEIVQLLREIRLNCIEIIHKAREIGRKACEIGRNTREGASGSMRS